MLPRRLFRAAVKNLDVNFVSIKTADYERHLCLNEWISKEIFQNYCEFNFRINHVEKLRFSRRLQPTLRSSQTGPHFVTLLSKR
jgi:hypothetical protein